MPLQLIFCGLPKTTGAQRIGPFRATEANTKGWNQTEQGTVETAVVLHYLRNAGLTCLRMPP